MSVVISTLCLFGGVYGIINYIKKSKKVTNINSSSTAIDTFLQVEDSKDNLLLAIKEAISTIEQFYTSNQENFIDQKELESLITQYRDLKVSCSKTRIYPKAKLNSIKDFQMLCGSLNERTEKHNHEFTLRELE